MTITTTEYALLADAAYLDIRGDANQPVLPSANWTNVDRTLFGLPATPSPSGFSAEVFRKGSEIVIAFQGTNPDPFSADGIQDWFTNADLAFFGWVDKQLKEAALLYQRVKAAFAEEPAPVSISFTGHSLGGGLAGLMSVYFDRPSVVFAPAPFEMAARLSGAKALRNEIAQAGFIDSALDQTANAPTIGVFASLRAGREQQIEGHAVVGEAVERLRNQSNTLVRWPLDPIDLGNTELSAVGRHSMQLHVAALESAALADASISLPQLLSYLADQKLFSRPLASDTGKDLLQRLLEFQFDPSAATPNGLNRFAEEANVLAGRSALAVERARLDGLIQILLQRFNEASDNLLAGPFFQTVSGGVSFEIGQVSGGDLKRIKGYQNKLGVILATDTERGEAAFSLSPTARLPTTATWYVQLGQADGGRLAVAGNQDAELLWGGPVDDSLAGGGGNDVLVGGLGNDIYVYGAGDAADTIHDSDGLGRIVINGIVPAGGTASLLPGTWRDEAQRIEFKKQGKDLVISGEGVGGSGDTITLKNFVNNDLAVDLRRQAKIEVTEGRNKNGFAEFAHEVATGVVSTIKEGLSKTYTIALNTAAQAGETLKIAVNGAIGFIKGVFGSDVVPFTNAQVEIAVPEGQNTVTFAVLQDGDIDADQNIELTATLQPAPGDTTGTPVSHTITLSLDAREEPQPGTTPATTRDILGDLEPLDADPSADGVQFAFDDLGNVVTTPNAAPDRADTLNDSAGSDFIAPGGGSDFVNAFRGGDDVIDAGTGEDTVNAGAGNDVIDGGEGDDQLNAEAGDDQVKGGAGHDVIRGDVAGGVTGNDVLEGSSGDDIVYGMGGDDELYGEDKIALADAVALGALEAGSTARGDYLQGMDGSDLEIGSSRSDFIAGGGGDNVLAGGGGADYIRGDAFYDAFDANWAVTKTIAGNIVNYTVNGATLVSEGTGDDRIHAGGGDDDVLAGAGEDVVFGEAGADTLFGEGGADTLLGGEGADVLTGDDPDEPGAQGGDFLDGGEGDDRLFGVGGNDALFGGGGDDELQGDGGTVAGGDDYLDGEAGDDILIGAAGSDQLYGGEGDDQLFSDSDDTALAEQGADELYGEAGDDLLQGYGGDDYLDGGDGIDTAFGMEGEDTLLGGAGDDQLVGDTGTDDASGMADFIDGGAGDDQLFGEGGDDTLLGDAGEDQIQGGFGDDTLEGGADDDVLIGQAGADFLAGGEGNDELAGDGVVADAGDGADVLDGGAGDDRLFGMGGDDQLAGDEGADQISGGAGADSLDGGEGDDLLQADAGDDVLSGGGGLDELQGGDGNDALDGGEGADRLFGELGDDVLEGGAGEDVISGGPGTDLLSGGADRDIYVYGLGFGADTISDSGGNTLQLNLPYFAGAFTLGLGSLELSFGNGDAIHIEGFDPGDPLANPVIDTFQFENRTLTLAEVLAQGFDLSGTPDADVIVGTAMADRIDALESDDVVIAKAGDDIVTGGAGDDLLLGEAGDDTLEGGAGADSLVGGLGDDLYLIGDAFDQVIENPGEGLDTAEASIDYTLGANLEELALAQGAGDLTGTGNELDNVISGNEGSNMLLGLDGVDDLSGGEGNDRLDGGAGADAMFGGFGDDRFIVDDEGDFVEEQLDFYEREIIVDPITGETTYARLVAAGGLDTVESSVSFALDQWTENLVLTGPAAIDGVGNVEANAITGNDADNSLYAYLRDGAAQTYPSIGVLVQQFSNPRDAHEEILQDAANAAIYRGRFPWFIPQVVDLAAGQGDTLAGGAGDDRLYGHLDNDTLEGGEGNDLLYGFAGADRPRDAAVGLSRAGAFGAAPRSWVARRRCSCVERRCRAGHPASGRLAAQAPDRDKANAAPGGAGDNVPFAGDHAALHRVARAERMDHKLAVRVALGYDALANLHQQLGRVLAAARQATSTGTKRES